MSSFAKIVMGSFTLLIDTFEKRSFSASEASFFVVRSKSRENSLVADVLEYNRWIFTEEGVAIYFLL